jgi:peptidyl-prolyl cis-trans isomerase C
MSSSPAKLPLVREPFVHFLVAGVLVFGLHRIVGEPAERPPFEIEPGLRESLRAEAARRQGRAPSEHELDAIVDRAIDDELRYREGLALGLDRADPVITRRIIQKLDFLAEDAATLTPPGQEEIERHYREHAADLARPERVTLEHVFFSHQRRGDAVELDAEEALARLGAEPHGAPRPRDLGDPFITGNDLTRVPLSVVRNRVGQDVADAAAGAEAGVWVGPVPSPWGVHLVRLQTREGSSLPPLAEVRDEVVRRIDRDRRELAKRELIARLRARHGLPRASVAETVGPLALHQAER